MENRTGNGHYLGVQSIENRFHQQNVGTAVDKTASLSVVSVNELVERYDIVKDERERERE